MSAVPLHPDFGRPDVIDGDVPGGQLINLAGLAELARTGDTPRCRTLYVELCAAWRRTEGQPITDAERRREVFATAWSAMLRKHGSAPAGGAA